MFTPILATKFYIPPTRPEFVSRPHLIERLNKGFLSGRKLTLISAPAGFGKTTLAGAWLRQLNIPVAWVSLDESDNDPTSFLTYFITAFHQIDPSIGQAALAMLQSPQSPPLETLITTLINNIVAAFTDTRCVFVLDDYHVIEAQPVHDALTFLLDHLPPQMHLIIITRSDPFLPLSRLRARGFVTDIRAHDLRFSFQETMTFLNQVMGLTLSNNQVTTLETRTEGWIAGLQLAALALQALSALSSQGSSPGIFSRSDQGNVTEFISTFSGDDRYIADYLVDEVLARCPQDTKDFLLKTSVLNQMTGPLCDAVTGREDGQKTLGELERRNLFIVPLDHRRQWYRYHHLFADLLRRRLHETEPDRIPQLHRRVADWFAKQGLNREALYHSLAAKDYQRAADLLKILALEILERGEHITVSGWINALPENLVRARPYLCVIHAWTLHLAGQFEAAEARLSDAETAMANLDQENDAEAEIIRGHIHTHRAYLTFIRGEHAKTISYARQALAELPPEATAIRAQTALYLGVAYRYQGKLQAALDIFTEAVTISQKMGGSFIAMLSFFNLAGLYVDQAHLHQARSIYEQALQFTKRHTGQPDMPFVGSAYVGLGSILRQWNELDDAYCYITKGVALDREWKVAELLALSCIDLAHIHRALGNDEQAGEALQEAKQIFAGFSPWGVAIAAAYQARLDLARGEVQSAKRWEQASGLNIDDDLEFHREVEYLTLTRVLLAQNQFEQALSLLNRLHQIAQTAGKMQSVLEILMLQAMALSAQGHTEQALIKLEQALAIGEPENYVRLFVDEGQPMARLLRQAASHGLASAYARKLLAAFGSETKADSQTLESPPPSLTSDSSSLTEPLSERELEILRLLKTELSGPEIARKLMISLSTVRTHTKNIYGKLGAHNRRQAVTRAKDLDLL